MRSPTLQTHTRTRRPWMHLRNMWTLTGSRDIIFIQHTQIGWIWKCCKLFFFSLVHSLSTQTHTGLHNQHCLILPYLCLKDVNAEPEKVWVMLRQGHCLLTALRLLHWCWPVWYPHCVVHFVPLSADQSRGQCSVCQNRRGTSCS